MFMKYNISSLYVLIIYPFILFLRQGLGMHMIEYLKQERIVILHCFTESFYYD